MFATKRHPLQRCDGCNGRTSQSPRWLDKPCVCRPADAAAQHRMFECRLPMATSDRCAYAKGRRQEPGASNMYQRWIHMGLEWGGVSGWQCGQLCGRCVWWWAGGMSCLAWMGWGGGGLGCAAMCCWRLSCGVPLPRKDRPTMVVVSVHAINMQSDCGVRHS